MKTYSQVEKELTKINEKVLQSNKLLHAARYTHAYDKILDTTIKLEKDQTNLMIKLNAIKCRILISGIVMLLSFNCVADNSHHILTKLINGKAYTYNNNLIYFDSGHMKSDYSPFRIKHPNNGGNNSLNINTLKKFSEWEELKNTTVTCKVTAKNCPWN